VKWEMLGGALNLPRQQLLFASKEGSFSHSIFKSFYDTAQRHDRRWGPTAFSLTCFAWLLICSIHCCDGMDMAHLFIDCHDHQDMSCIILSIMLCLFVRQNDCQCSIWQITSLHQRNCLCMFLLSKQNCLL
jgi:hypothetical protein